MSCISVTALPMPDDVIACVNKFSQKQKMSPQ